MAGKERNGKRRTRNEFRKRVPDLGYYYIVTDTQETEKNYLEGLKRRLPEHLKDRLVIKVDKAKTNNLIAECLADISMTSQYREPWIVLDRDKVVGFDRIIEDAAKEGISVGWSNPCIEIWFSAYFGDMRMCETSVSCNEHFSSLFRKKTGIEYNKADKRNYEHLVQYGDEHGAFQIAERRLAHYIQQGGRVPPSRMFSCTTLHKLVMEISLKMESS